MKALAAEEEKLNGIREAKEYRETLALREQRAVAAHA